MTTSDNAKATRLSGWLVLDKPAGLTSTQALNRVKAKLRVRKMGHGGTLDPLASGLLPLALGEATKTVGYIMEGLKSYRFTVRWGIARTTDDGEGEITEESAARPSREAIEAAIPQFLGEIQQTPPTYSAIKVDGRRAYDIAREGGDPQLEPRPVHLESLDLVSIDDRDHATFVCTCGKGFYVRALARDLGETLGTPAHLSALRRTRVGAFDSEEMIPLDALEAMDDPQALQHYLLPVETALADIPALALTEAEANRLRSGQSVSLLKRANLERLRELENGDVVCAKVQGRAVALARFEAGAIRPVRILHV
ncbi:tRNA pseudouridine(55) synthase TruB [Limimonas halophila]|nr:tRNA pseudouridine(55) synthase TruB [Limimonas halophila]